VETGWTKEQVEEHVDLVTDRLAQHHVDKIENVGHA